MSLIALFWWIWSIYKDGDFPASPNNLFLRLPLVPLEAHLVVSHVPHQFQIQLRSSFPSFIQTVQNKEVHYFSQVALPTFSSSSVNLLCPHYFPWQPGRSHWTGGGCFQQAASSSGPFLLSWLSGETFQLELSEKLMQIFGLYFSCHFSYFHLHTPKSFSARYIE